MNASTISTPGLKRTKAELLETVSASRLGTWMSCRLKFYFRYMAGIPKPPSIAMRVGTVLHAVLQQWNLARWRKAPLEGSMIRTVFEQAWTAADLEQPVDWGEGEETAKTGSFALLETYLRETPISLDERPEGVEVAAELDLASHGLPRLVGIIDLVRSGGRIVDYKTTRRTPDPGMILHTTEVQTTGYAMLYRAATDEKESDIELHHLVRLKTPKVIITQAGPATQRQQDNLLRCIESYTRGLELEDFISAPGLQCAGCEFFHECRLWR